MSYNPQEIIGVILSGGLARRMKHQDKSLLQLANKPLFEYALESLLGQCDTIIINSNDPNQQLLSYKLPIIKDTLNGFLGPLAGILAGMEWAKEFKPNAKWIISIPVDTPFLPDNLVQTLYQSMHDSNALLACAASNGRTHPVIGLWPIALLDDLRIALKDEGVRKMDLWTSRYDIAHPNFSYKRIDPFFNINCHEDLQQAEELLKQR